MRLLQYLCVIMADASDSNSDYTGTGPGDPTSGRVTFSDDPCDEDNTQTSCSGGGAEVEYECKCPSQIIIKSISGGGPLYKFYKKNAVEPFAKKLGKEAEGAYDADDGEGGLYLMIESCGCCIEICCKCDGTTTTTTTSTTPPPSTPPPSTPPPGLQDQPVILA